MVGVLGVGDGHASFEDRTGEHECHGLQGEGLDDSGADRAPECSAQYDCSVAVFDAADRVCIKHCLGVEEQNAADGRVEVGVEHRVASGTQVLPWVGLQERRRGTLGDLALDLFVDGCKQLLLTPEMMVERALRDFRCLGDLIERGRPIAALAEQCACSLEERFARHLTLLHLLALDIRTLSMHDEYRQYASAGHDRRRHMPKYVIERDLPGAGELSAEELQGMAAKSNHVIGELGPEIRWLTSYVTDDKIYCVYVAPDEDILFEHARCGAFPADRISKVSTVIDPSTAD